MDPLGILIYGYDSKSAKLIKESIEQLIEQDIIMISGSGKEKSNVIDILDKGPDGTFENKEDKILVFLGFESEQVNTVLSGFSSDHVKSSNLIRPIFCGLTEQNINWKLDKLVEHLAEEDKYWKEKAAEK